jgi:hypothetical protein
MESRSVPAAGAAAAESASQQAAHPPGWYRTPEGPGLRYWDGTKWTESYHPGSLDDSPTRRELIWALALGFGATGGVVGFLSIPIAAFYFPLGFGTAGAALSIVALTQEGETPWYAAVAIIASIAALALGISAYSDYSDAQEGLDAAQQEAESFVNP